jgi:hypothetical protein
LARHPNTHTPILAHLSASNIYWVVLEVVKNPSTPKSILLDVIGKTDVAATSINARAMEYLSNHHRDSEIREAARIAVRETELRMKQEF